MPKKIDLTGKRFDRLEVLRDAGRSPDKSILWECRCDCGTVCLKRSGDLRSGKSRSCGCLRTELIRKASGECAFHRLYRRYKQECAEKRGLEFTLTEEEFRYLTQRPCHYCGAGPSLKMVVARAHGDYLYNGIDRIDNLLGYVSGNCVACCKQCNWVKGTLGVEGFLD